MATFPISFRSDSDRIHGEHKALVAELAAFQSALEDLAFSDQVFANLYSADRIAHHGRRLASLLPEHFQHEETTLLPTVSHVSPELEEFAREICHEHQQIRQRLSEFCRALGRREAGDDVAEAVNAVKQSGRTLAHDLSAHLALEESQLDGFL